MTAPIYRKINGCWYILKSHVAVQLERAIFNAQFDLLAELKAKRKSDPRSKVIQETAVQ